MFHRSRGKRKSRLAALLCLGALEGITLVRPAAVGDGTTPDVVLLFTHDLHASILPHRILTPDGRVETRGGFARIAAMVAAEREQSGDRVLAVDGGDMIVGTFFQTIFQTEAPEIRLLGLAGFDAATLGNHEFDFGPGGLAQALSAAKAHGARLALVSSNTRFDPMDGRDDLLEAAWRDYPVRDYLVLEKNGLRVGIFGLMGVQAADDAPDAVPVAFDDPIVRAREMTDMLRREEKADLVVLLSHGGTSADRKRSEDERLAAAVPGVDVIVSGHTHTRLSVPIRVGSTWIVSAGERGEDLGALGLARAEGGHFEAVSYELRPVVASVPQDAGVAAEIASLQAALDRRMDVSFGIRPEERVSETAFALTGRVDDPTRIEREVGIGDLIADACRDAVRRAEPERTGEPLIVVFPWGHIRDSLYPGEITVEDVFRVLSLGTGPDGRPGYPLVAVGLTGREIRRLFEVETTIAPGKEDAHLQVAGASVRFNPRRVPFDRVTKIDVEESGGRMRPLEPDRVYRVAANLYMAKMIAFVSRASHGILKLEPKDGEGRIRADFENLIIDGDPAVPGVQEIKEWAALAEFLRSRPDSDGNGIPDVPSSYSSSAGRMRAEPSWNPAALVAGAHGPTVVATGLVLAALTGVFFLGRGVRRRLVRKRKASGPPIT